MGHRDDANQFDRERAAAEAALSASQARAEKLTQALRPFAINAGAVSLSGALGHITREDLIRAREALSVTGGGE
jgi:hypothetical protein